MNINDGREWFGFGIDNRQLNKEAKEANKIFGSVGQAAMKEGEVIDNSFRKAGKAFAAFLTAQQLASFTRAVVRVRGEIQALEISFETLVGNKDKAQALFGSIKDFAVNTPLQLNDLAKGAQTLLGFNIEAEKVMPILKQIGDISMGNADRFQSLTLAFSQMSSTGKLMGQDLLQMINAGFNPLVEIANKSGKSVKELKEQMSAGAISVDMVADAFASASGKGGKFYNMLEKQSKGIEGAVSNMQGAWDDALNSIGQKNDGIIVDSINLTTTLIKNYEVLGKTILSVAAAYGTYKAVLMSAAVLERGKRLANTIRLVAMFRKELGLLKAAQQAFNVTALANPYVLLASVLIGAAAALTMYANRLTLAEKAQKKLNEEKDKFTKQVAEEHQAIEANIGIIKDDTETQFNRVKAYRELQKLAPQLTSAYTQEKIATLNLAEAKKKLNEQEEAAEYDFLQAQIAKYTNEVNRYKESIREQQKALGGTRHLDKKLEEAKATLKIYKEQAAEVENIRKQVEENNKPINIKIAEAEAEVKQIKEEFAKAKKAFEEEQAEAKKWGFRPISVRFSLDFYTSKSKLKNAQKKLSKLQEKTTTEKSLKEEYTAAKSAWEKAKAELDKINQDKANYTRKQYKQAQEAEKAAREEFKGLGGETSTQSDDKKLREDFIKQTKKYQEMANEAAISRARAEEDAEFMVQQAKIDAMQDSSKKEEQLLMLSHKKKLAELSRQREDYLREKIRTERALFEANPKNNGKTFDAGTIKLSSEEESRFNSLEKSTKAQQNNDIAALVSKEKQAMNEYLSVYGNYLEKKEALTQIYNDKIALALTEGEKLTLKKQLEKELAELSDAKFKAEIDWSGIFGNLGEQSLKMLRYNLQTIEKQFERNKDAMSVEAIKDYQEAIAKLNEEIASRNPFIALHQSISKLTKDKQVYTEAAERWAEANREVAEAQRELNEAIREEKELAGSGEVGEEINKKQEKAQEKKAKAQEKLAKAQNKKAKAERDTKKAGNDVTKDLNSFTNAAEKAAGKVMNFAGKTEKLAAIFSTDLANSISKGIHLTEELVSASTDVLHAIGDIGIGAAEGVGKAVEASAAGSAAAAKTGASAMSTIEKASIILTIITAAVQVATAIADMFNDDDAKQKEIERLQGRIDQLQWELDNEAAVLLQNKQGKALDNLKKKYAEVSEEIIKSYMEQRKWGKSSLAWLAASFVNSEKIINKTAEKIADAYARVEYTADKALGKRYENSSEQLDNLAKQQVLIQKQIQAEQDKKDTDNGKIKEYEQKIEELGAKMASIINGMVEDIIGGSATEIAEQLGNAFFDAASRGEDAMEAWHKKTKDLVADIVKRLLIQKFLEEPIGDLMNKYKKKWFDGKKFKGKDVVLESLGDFKNDLDGVGDLFGEIFETLPNNLKDKLIDAEEVAAVQGERKGFATASQDSIDELSGRALATNTELILANEKLLDIKINVAAIKDTIAMNNGQLDEIKGLQLQALEHLDTIAQNTNELPSMNKRLEKIERNTRNL